MLEVTKCAPQFGIKQLGMAFANFFRNPKHFGYPKYKRKFRDDSFTISNDQFKLEDSRIHIPKLGWVRMCEPLRFENAKVLSAVISRQADSWYVSLTCELTVLSHLIPAKNQGRIGIDLGINKLATLSNGLEFEAPKPLKRLLGKLRKKQRKMFPSRPRQQESKQACQGSCSSSSANRQHPQGCAPQADDIHCCQLLRGSDRGSER